MFFETPPKDFNATIHAAFCFYEHGNTILLLKRPPGGRNSNTWCIPGGKLENGESVMQALLRELFEETGLVLKENELLHVGTFYVRLPELDYVLYAFRKVFIEKPVICLEPVEHVEARWVTLEEALELPLIRSGKELFLHYKSLQ